MEWISLEKRLPELDTPVLVYGGTVGHPCKRKEVMEGRFYKRSNCDLVVCSRDTMYWKASHWQPLPQPPSSSNSD